MKNYSIILSLLALAASSVSLTAAPPAAKYAAHEWGTFTSVQSGDGTPLTWRPLESSRLPGFVHDWTKPGLGRYASGTLAFGKGPMVALQRMETPVIYFYPEKEQSVDVSVNFPQGFITEWYPQARQIGPSSLMAPFALFNGDLGTNAGAGPETMPASLPSDSTTKESRAHWAHLNLLPARQHRDLIRQLPLDSSGSHYFSARETDSAYVRVDSIVSTNPAPELEKFIFYRGVGNFATPLQVKVESSNVSPLCSEVRSRTAITLTNTGSESLHHLFLLSVENHTGKFTYLKDLAAGEARTLQIDLMEGASPVDKTSSILGEQMTRSLSRAGLYPREAAAMVNTWKDSWFSEDGVRVLYLLPRAWTDRTLPLSLEPAPRELVRVMVGRTEVLTPEFEQHLATSLTRASEGDTEARDQVSKMLKRLGRFAETALQLAARNVSPQASEIGWKLRQTSPYE